MNKHGSQSKEKRRLSEVQMALAESMEENDQLRGRVAQLEALLAEAQLRQENLEETIRRLLTTDDRPVRSRKSMRSFKPMKGKCKS